MVLNVPISFVLMTWYSFLESLAPADFSEYGHHIYLSEINALGRAASFGDQDHSGWPGMQSGGQSRPWSRWKEDHWLFEEVQVMFLVMRAVYARRMAGL